MARKSPFIESVRRMMRLRRYSIRTEQSYLYWIKSYIRFHRHTHPEKMAKDEVIAFLDKPLGNLGFRLATKPKHLPVVLNVNETLAILDKLEGVHRLIVEMMYGSGLRVSECLRLRVQEIDYDRNSVTVHRGKSNRNLVTLLSELRQAIYGPLLTQSLPSLTHVCRTT